jgi:hypothetical protein
VAPGSSLGGFSLRSDASATEGSSYAMTSWYRGLTSPGSAAQGDVEVPSMVSPALTLTNALRSSTNTFQFSVLGIPSYLYFVQASSNLLDWTVLGTNAAPFVLRETNASRFSQRFYRAAPAFDLSTVTGD